MIGLFFELGPSHIDESIKPVFNPHAWNTNASVIFLEQPVNVGFSYSGGKGVESTDEAARDVNALLGLFFHQFPEYAHQDFHLVGESYGGHYVPAFAAEILSHEHSNINLKSAVVGNGMSDTLRQYPSYKPYACDGAGGYEPVVAPEACASMERALPRCQELIQRCYEAGSKWLCVPAFIYCQYSQIVPYTNTGANPYDVRGKCESESDLCYAGISYTTRYLNTAEVMEAVGAEVDSYGTCNWEVNRGFMMTGDWVKPIYKRHAAVLERIPTLIYAGDADFVCNWLGIHWWTEELEWKHKNEFNRAIFEDLYFLPGGEAEEEDRNGTEPYGRAKSSHNFTFLQLYEAGHLVPHDQPRAANDMINRWIRGEFWA